MGILDAIKGKADDLDKTYNPLRKVGDAIEAAGKNIGKPPDPQAAYEAKEKAMNAKTPQQAAYEAKEKYMNRNNPGYVPRAKGGPVKAGGAPMKNVDNSGMTKMKMGKC